MLEVFFIRWPSTCSTLRQFLDRFDKVECSNCQDEFRIWQIYFSMAERSRQSEVCSFHEVVEALGRGRCGRMPISFERFHATASDLAKCARNSTRWSHSERPAGKSLAASCHLNQLNISRC